jgi:DNA-directed RNA polymerase alpha subunit
MSGIRKSTDSGLSNAERKTLRATEAQEAISDHNDARKAFHENRERLRQARLERENAAGPMPYPAPEIPDDTLVARIHFSTRIRNALTAGGLKTAGEIREASDATLLSLQDLGAVTVRHLRERLGLKAEAK